MRAVPEPCPGSGSGAGPARLGSVRRCGRTAGLRPGLCGAGGSCGTSPAQISAKPSAEVTGGWMPWLNVFAFLSFFISFPFFLIYFFFPLTLERVLAFFDPGRLRHSLLLSACCERFCVRGLSFGFPVETENQPARGHFFGKKNYFAALPLQFSFPVFLCSSWCGVCFLVMKYVPIGFLNINPRGPINKCNAACRRNTSRSFAMQTWVLQAPEGLGRLWEITVPHTVDIQGWTVLAV